VVIIEDRPLPAYRQPGGTGKPYSQYGIEPRVYDGPGSGSPEQRLREQDQVGVDAEIMYTHPYAPVFFAMVASQDGEDSMALHTHPVYAGFWRGTRQDEGYKAVIRAYNEFLVEEYCAACPSRLIAMGVIPDTGVDDAITEMEYCARAGLKGVALHRFPSGKGYPTRDDDCFWQAALDMAMPITFHAHAGTTAFGREGLQLQSRRQPGYGLRERDPVSLLPRFAGDRPIAPVQMAYAAVFDRFPQLRIYWAGPQAEWLPSFLCEMDNTYEPDRWDKGVCGFEPARSPSYYLKTHCLWGFMKDPYAVRIRDEIGVGHLIWGSDFGHAGGHWADAADVIERCFAGVSEDERHRMLAGNVLDFFRLRDQL
jgi:predicted TIM-barrel fold metal-dependent hydrolase